MTLDETRRRVRIGAALVDSYSFDEVVDAIVARAASGGATSYVVTPNAQHIVMLRSDPRLRAAYDAAWLSVPDGVPLLWAARLLGGELRGRVNGTDLFEAVCARAAREELSVLLVGGRPGAADRAAAILAARHPGLRVQTICPPQGFETDPVERARVVDIVRSAAPQLLFIALGAPRQEYWMHDHYASLGVPVLVGIGGSFELVSGMLPRAPSWMRRAGLEWSFRLLAEPRRLWRRYAIAIPVFAALVVAQLVQGRLARRSRP